MEGKGEGGKRKAEKLETKMGGGKAGNLTDGRWNYSRCSLLDSRFFEFNRWRG